MFKSFDLFSDSNTPEDYDLINQDNNISFQNINDRSNDLFSFSYEDNTHNRLLQQCGYDTDCDGERLFAEGRG